MLMTRAALLSSILTAFLSCGVAARPMAAQDPAGSNAEPSALDSEAIARARAVLADVARTYREAPAIVDEVNVTRTAAGRHHVQTFTLRLGPGSDAMLRNSPYTFLSHGEQVYGTHDEAPTRYFQVPLVEGLLQTLQRHPGGFGVVAAPDDALRRTAEDGRPAAAFSLGLPLDLQLAGHESVEVDGRSMHQVHFIGRGGVAQARIDPATNLVRSINIVLLPKGAPTSSATRIDVELSPVVIEQPPAAESFDPSGRTRVDQIRRLVAFDVGDLIPAGMELETPEGIVERLGDRRGRVVVLDFWAASCGGCLRRLPMTNELARWAMASGAPIDVVGVYCREGKAEDRPRRAAAFWGRKGLLFPTLIDRQDMLARGFGFEENNGLVVLDREGRVLAIVHGAPEDMVERLKELTATAAQAPAPVPQSAPQPSP